MKYHQYQKTGMITRVPVAASAVCVLVVLIAILKYYIYIQPDIEAVSTPPTPLVKRASNRKTQSKTVAKDLKQTKRKRRIRRKKVDTPAEEGVYGVVAIAGVYDTGGSSNKLVVFEGVGKLPIRSCKRNTSQHTILRRIFRSYRQCMIDKWRAHILLSIQMMS